jgi:hypothetical protein
MGYTAPIRQLAACEYGTSGGEITAVQPMRREHGEPKFECISNHSKQEAT